jgi:hypothetical protein
VSILLAPFALILVNLDIVVLLMVIILRGLPLLLRGDTIIPLRFPLWFGILVKVLSFIVLHMVDGVTM